MRTYLLLCITALVVDGARAGLADAALDNSVANSTSKCVLDASYATIGIFDAQDKKLGDHHIVVKDRAWLDQMAEILATALYLPTSHLLAITPPTLFYDKSGVQVLYLEVFGSTVRINGQDYNVGPEVCASIHALLHAKTANQSTDPALSSGAPAAGQPARHP
jgi:hypothetical protein